MPKITGPGYVVGVIVWLVIMWYATTQSNGDLLLFAILGIGIIAPAWIAASIVSSVFGPE